MAITEIKQILEEIERLRDKLNKIWTDKGINCEEALKISQELDLIVARYLKEIRKKE